MSLKFNSRSTFTALIVEFIFHNIEEAISICNYPIQSPVSFIEPASCRQFLVAVTVLSIFGLIAFGLAMRSRNPAVYLFISTAIVSTLLFNVFVPHIIVALYTINYTPGLITAVAFILSLGLLTISKNRLRCKSRKQFYQYIGLGLVIGYQLFAGILRLGIILV